MGILIGMDEAGYGPNYGPLVVAATAWHVPDDAPSPGVKNTKRAPAAAALSSAARPQPAVRNSQSEVASPPDLYRLLRAVVAKRPSDRRIAIADSKALYSPGAGLRQLERGLHAVLHSLDQASNCWSSLVTHSQADPDCQHRQACWPTDFNCQLPVDATAPELERLAERFARACETANVRPLLIRARLVYPREFNELTTEHGSKGAALSHITVALLREVTTATAPLMPTSPTSGLRTPTSTHAVCDKHGGRNFYAALLQHHFSEHWIEPIHESRPESRYEWGPPEARTSVAFRMNGERFLPTALASMTAKYLRELSMHAFNAFWSAHIPNIRPTAGYPNDARRFREDIAATQQKLKIDDHLIWRNK